MIVPEGVSYWPAKNEFVLCIDGKITAATFVLFALANTMLSDIELTYIGEF